jgi:hypothetical protein
MQQEDILQSAGLIGDQPTGKDYLGFRPYVLAVAAFLTDTNTIPPLTVSIEGEWGSGKSSFLKQLKEELIPEWKRPFYSVCFLPWLFSKKRQRRYSVSFNPWRYSENEALWAAFAVEFEHQISKTAPLKRKVWFKVRQVDYTKIAWDLVKIFIPAFVAFLVTWLLPGIFDRVKDSDIFRTVVALFVLIPAIFPAKDAFKELKDKLTKEIMSLKLKDYLLERPNYSGKLPFLDKFHEDIQKLTSSLCGNDPIYVFIDDLDRCEPGQALELMQALNLLISDELKIIFILAIDRKKVAAGYAAKHFHLVQYLDPVEFRLGEPQAERFKTYAAVQYGYEFLEKFIQVPFQLPIPKEPNLNKLLNHIVKFETKESSQRDQKQSQDSKTTSMAPPKPETSISEPVSAPFKLEEHPKIAQDIMVLIAASLGNNPRRIKKFFNIYRLQTYIGSRTGLFAMKLAGDDYKQGLSPIQLAKILVIAQAWPHFIDHWQQFRYFVLYLRDYTNSKKHWSADKLQEFKNTVCGMAGFQAGSDEAEQYWKIFTHWSKQEPLMGVFNYKADEGEQHQIWAIPIGDLLKISPVYKTEQFTIPPMGASVPPQSGEVASSQVSIRSIDPSQVPPSEYSAARLDEILKEVEEYLNTNLKEGETRYFLDGAAAETAYVMRVNGRTLPEIKAEIDRLLGRSKIYTEEQLKQEAIQNWLGGEAFRYQDSVQDKATVEQLLNDIRSEAANSDKYPYSIDEGIVESVNIMFQSGTPLEEIKTEILKYLSRPIDSETTESKSNFQAEEPLGDGPETRNPITGEWEDPPKNYGGMSYGGLQNVSPPVPNLQEALNSGLGFDIGYSGKRVRETNEGPVYEVQDSKTGEWFQVPSPNQVMQEALNKNIQEGMEQAQVDPSTEKKPFAYGIEGQGYSEGH